MTRELIKVDKNGTKYFRVIGATCPRCGGAGRSNAWSETGFICYECGGSGITDITEKEYDPVYLAKLEQRRAKKAAKREADLEADRAEVEKAEKILEDRKRAEEERRSRSEYIGKEGDKLEIEVTLNSRSHYKIPSFGGYGEDLITCYNFSDDNGNIIVWKTSGSLGAEDGERVKIKATIKKLAEYKGGKQTELSRVKILGRS